MGSGDLWGASSRPLPPQNPHDDFRLVFQQGKDMKLTDSNKAHLLGAIVAIIAAIGIFAAAVGAVNLKHALTGPVAVSGYGIDKEVTR